jgi:hypothetical protein
MSFADDRRSADRILSHFSLVILSDIGEILDDNALAHDLSTSGFKMETLARLKTGQVVRYRLRLDAGGDLRGQARVAWVEESDLSQWAGASFLRLSWADRRRVVKVTRPNQVDWNAIADRAIFALSVFLVTLLTWNFLSNPTWRTVLALMMPKIFAAVAMGLALRALLQFGR